MSNLENIKASLSVLGLKKNAQRVLLYLIEHDISPAASIASALHLPKSSVYDALNELIELSLVTEMSENKGKEFGIVDLERLSRVCNQRLQEMKDAQEHLFTYIKSTDKVKRVSRPKVKFYYGHEGIRQAFRDTMWHSRCKETFLMWPTREMLKVLGPEFSKWHSEERLKHEVVIHAIRKHTDRNLEKEKDTENAWLKSAGWKNYRFVRYAPKHIKWEMSYWIYDDKCLFASGGDEKFGFIVHSREFADMMKMLWKQMWEVSIK